MVMGVTKLEASIREPDSHFEEHFPCLAPQLKNVVIN